MKIVLEGERPMSWNKFYSGMHWSARATEADRVHHIVWGATPLSIFENRVDIHVTAFFKNRPQDPDNLCSKLYIDGLIGRVIENDTRQFVRKVTVQSEIDRENPRVEIEINETT